jgi:choline monooxygenase
MNILDRHPPKPAGRFDPDPEKSYTLPASYYTDPSVYEREKRTIFYRSWNFACHTSQVAEPGAYVTVKVADQSIIVMRSEKGELGAFFNVCSHRAHELLKGCGKTKLITCPYHAWTYHNDGRLRSAVGQKKVADFQAAEFSLKRVKVEEYAGFVFVNLDPDAKSLRKQAGGLEKEMLKYSPDVTKLRLAKRMTYELKANWKNVVDNFLECYHCSVAHPAFVDLVDVQKYRTKTYGIYSSHISPPGRCDNTAYTVPEGEERDFSAWWVWPNITFNVFPGPANMALLHIMPTGPETTLEHFDFYNMSGEIQPCEVDAIEYFDKVLQVEDISLVESVQRGLHSLGYTQGRFIVDHDRTFISEHGLHHFHSLVLEALGEMPAKQA